jgi:hypothetical protein
MTAMDEEWDRMFEGLRAVHAEMHAGFSELRAEIVATRADLWSLHKQVLAIVAAAAVGPLGLLGAFVAAQF